MRSMIVVIILLSSTAYASKGPFFWGFDSSYNPPEELEQIIYKGRDAFYRAQPGGSSKPEMYANKMMEPSQALRYSSIPDGKTPYWTQRDVADRSRGYRSIWGGPTRFRTTREQACYWFLGLEMMYHTLSVSFAMRGDQRAAAEFKYLAEAVAQARGSDRCNNGDGSAARLYLLNVTGGWRMTVEAAGKADRYNLTPASGPCVPVPMPGVVACAPQASEVYVPSSVSETALLAAAVVAVLTPLPGDEAAAAAALSRCPAWAWVAAHPEAFAP